MAHTAYLDHRGVVAMAHRGFSRDGLENTLQAFAAAVDLGYSYVETDVHVTADGVLVSFHDDTLDRVSDGSGMIRDLPWAQVREAKIGNEPIPLMDDLFAAWPALRLNIDCKHVSAAPALAAAIEKHAAHDRVLVASFDDATREQVLKGLSRPVATSAGSARTRQAVLASKAHLRPVVRQALGPVDALQVPHRQGRITVVTRSLVEAAHRLGKQVHVWTVNEPSEMHELLDLGVDGLISDRADLLKTVLLERGQWT
ncbi:glycerophosphodiester phosphodiesterase [Calidifontibacter terrae]